MRLKQLSPGNGSERAEWMNAPRFSIVVPSYNRHELLKRTLETLLAQQYTDFEIIVVDDGGSDSTADMIAKLGDDRIKYFWKENGERGAARNYGYSKSTGEWINFFDSDDTAYENHLQVAHEFIMSHPQAKAFHTSYDIVDDNLEVLKHVQQEGILNQRLLKFNILSCNGVFAHRSVLAEAKFPEDREFTSGEDWLLWLRIAARHDIWGVSTITSTIVQHGGRSMLNWSSLGDKMAKSAAFFETYLRADEAFKTRYGQFLEKCISEEYNLTALYYSLDKKKTKSIYWLKKSVKADWKKLFTRRSVNIIRKIVFNR